MATAAVVIFLALVAGSTAAQTPSAIWPYHYVDVVNELGGGKVLLVHCKSRDDDLGPHNITVGSQYEFRFKLNVLIPTLFTCYAAPDGSQHVDYTAFKEDEAEYRESSGHHTFWIAKDDGIYLRRKGQEQDERYFAWQSGQNPKPNFHY
ncbi:unnamed protein product [Linum tenue]|uniref:S-protein homolog n=1 Tax=Linum tenue TaxID=586396 RepID=A0AAV0NJ64_9ROSI|nr:unnamed protein product [Linum tenue]